MNSVSIFLAVMIAFTMTVCVQQAAAEELIERTVDISDVRKLHISGGGAMEVSIGDKESLVVRTRKSALDQIKVTGKGDILKIKHKSKHFLNSNQESVQYRLFLKSLEGLNVSGNLTIKILSNVQAKSFQLKAAGAPKIFFPELTVDESLQINLSGAVELDVAELRAKTLTLNGTGAVTAKLSGSLDHGTVNLTGAGQVDADTLRVNSLIIKMTGACDARFWVLESLNYSLTGASHLKYYGSPSIESNIHGVSDVHKLGEAPQIAN